MDTFFEISFQIILTITFFSLQNRHSITSTTLNTNRNSDHSNHSYSNSNSSENLNQSNSRLSMSNENEPPLIAQQPIVISPLAYTTNNNLNPVSALPTAPLLVTATNGVNNCLSNGTNYQEYFDINTGLNTGSTSMMSNGVKKRVWTPVHPNSTINRANQHSKNLASDPAFLNGSQNNLSELQKSYFKLLEEKNNFKEQLTSKSEENRHLKEEITFKDKRINQLENKLNSLMNNSNAKRIDLIDTATDC